MARVQTGLVRFIAAPPAWALGRRVGLLCNPASIDHRFRHARDLIHAALPGQLAALFSPQHGFHAEKQDNMVESADMRDPLLDIPVFSLYGATRVPTRRMFDLIDLLVVDLQDVGTRVYTFAYTLSYCLEAARRFHKTVVVLDRPNPINGQAAEGNCLADDCRSFVGRYPIPMRHGLTIGELARLFNTCFGIGCELEIIPMQGWNRKMYFPDTGLPWVCPSPNLPTPASALVYAGQVLWEGTNVSEGRGTTQPFELFGAPFIDIAQLRSALRRTPIPGAVLRGVVFEPTANKWQGRPCRGFQIHVIDPEAYRPYTTSLRLLQAVLRLYPDQFQWKPPPYEYEIDRLPIDLIIGDRFVRERLEQGKDIDEIAGSWQGDLEAFEEKCHSARLYP